MHSLVQRTPPKQSLFSFFHTVESIAGGRRDRFIPFPLAFLRKGTQLTSNEFEIGSKILFSASISVTLRAHKLFRIIGMIDFKIANQNSVFSIARTSFVASEKQATILSKN